MSFRSLSFSIRSLIQVSRCWTRQLNLHNNELRYSTVNFANSLGVKRSMCSMANRDLFYDEIVKLSANKEIFLIDVREPSEIQETGKLPGSIHIPLGEIPSALNLDASSFEQKYGTPKPGSNAPLVFSCRSGKRSQIALKSALDLGYSKSRHYAGGWLDWEAHNKQNS